MNLTLSARNGVLLIALSLITCCGGHGAGQNPSPTTSPGALERARHHSSRGDHLTASRHLEVALTTTGEELEILPRLVVEQIRAGRLLAALDTTSRLVAIDPQNTHAAEIHQLVQRLIGVERPLQKEVNP